MVKFIQTSDWQIGMKGGGLGDAGPIVRETRIESIQNVLKAAQEHKVDFVLLCGDIFEHNMISQEDVKKVVTILNKYPKIPLYLLPGNHDILGPDCVYERPIFQGIEHLTILRTNDPLEVNGAILHPCPILLKFTINDIVATIPDVSKADGIHIGIAHGTLKGKSPVPIWEDVDLPIDPGCVDRTSIDYLALGHWHSYRPFEDSTGVTRIAYSGTHEQTQYSEDNAGQCLLVQIDGKGISPKIEPIKTGKLRWVSNEFEMKDASSLIELKSYFKSIEDMDMIRLVIYGEIPLESKEELDNMLEFQTTLHKNFRVKTDSLSITVPAAPEERYDFGDSTLNQTESYLKNLLSFETDPRKRRIIIEAIIHLQKFGREAEL